MNGTWAIKQSYFDAVYPQQEKRRKNFPVPVLAEPVAKAVMPQAIESGEARESTESAGSDQLSPKDGGGTSRGGETLWATTQDEAREWYENDIYE